MVISRIVRLRHPGVLRNFTWPAELPDFGRYNLIYGWNGSGKTIISRLLRNLEGRNAPEEGEITFTIDGADISGDDFPQVALPVRVFNRDFVTETVFPIDGSSVNPIFVIGEKSVEKQKEVVQLKTTLADAQTTLESVRQQRQDSKTTLDGFCIDRATLIRETLRSSGSSSPYTNYDKSDFRKHAEEMVAKGDAEIQQLNQEDRGRLLAQHQATLKPSIQQISYRPPMLATLAESVSQLLKTTMVSAVVQSLVDDPELSSWVHHGLGLHKGHQTTTCLFCDQTLPEDRLASLEAHFSIEHEKFLTHLEVQRTEMNEASETASTLALPDPAQLYEDLTTEYTTARDTLRITLKSNSDFLIALGQALMDKKGRAFESLEFSLAAPEGVLGAINRLNEIIREHNQACDDLQGRASVARQRLEGDSVAGTLEEFQTLVATVQASETSIEEADADVKRLNEKIARLEREIVEHRLPAEELNDDLRQYLGHDELYLAVEDNGYTVTRNGLPAKALSEGETTAVALLYFLKSLQDQRFDLANGVVVLDDPVSSLDANALYLAFGFIRERTEQAGQLFILTHNFTFFRQVRNWFRHLPRQGRSDDNQRPARFYMLDFTHDGEQRCSGIRRLDPLLEKYESEYHYLFDRIYREAAISEPTDLRTNYTLPNVARRLLEAFLAFRQPQVSGGLWEKLKGVGYDKAKKLRIIRFLHTYSHYDALGDPEHDLSTLSEARAVLRDLMALIKTEDPRHFEAMTTLIDSRPGETEDG